MKSIALIIPLLTGGGAERTVSNLSLELSREYDVHVIVFDGRGITYPYKGTLHDLSIPASNNPVMQLLNVWRRVKAIKKIKRENNIAASISFLDGPNLVNCYSGVGDKIITSVRNEQSEYYRRSEKNINFYRRKQKIFNKKSDLIVAISEGVRKDLINNFGTPPQKVITIYNPCDAVLIKQKSEIQDKHQECIEELSITTMGRLVLQKNQWTLIRAFKMVLDIVPNAHLYILGEGKLRKKLEKLVLDLDIEKAVHFMGYVKNPHVYIKQSKVFVLPSLYEGLGNVLLEAMACDVPCIAADCRSGPREIIEGTANVEGVMEEYKKLEYGILVSNDSQTDINAFTEYSNEEQQIANAIIDVLTDSNLRDYYSRKSRERAKHFSPLTIKAKWIDVIERG